MIPIVSLSHLIVLPFMMFISWRLYLSFKETKEKNVGYFFLAFLMMTIMEVILTTPGLVFKNPLEISTAFSFYPFFMLLLLTSISAIPFSILKMKKTEIIFIVLMFLTAVITSSINLNNVKPAVIYYNAPFVYWEDTRGETMNIFLGALGAVILIFITFFFLINGLKNQERYVKIRSFLISGGMAIFLLAAVINFVLGAIFIKQYVTTLISTFLLIAGSISVFVGVRYKK